MEKSFKKRLAIGMLSVFASNFIGTSVRANNNNSSFTRNFLIATVIAVPAIGLGVGVGAYMLSNKDDGKDKKDYAKDKKADILKNQDETIKFLKMIYSSFENIIQLSRNPNVDEFKQNIKNYLVEGDNYQDLKGILLAFYQVCGGAEELSNEQFVICLKKISQEEGVHFVLSDDKNVLIVTKNSDKFLLINNYSFVSNIRMNKNEIKDEDLSENRNEFDKLFVSWKNKELQDGDFVDKVGVIVKSFDSKLDVGQFLLNKVVIN